MELVNNGIIELAFSFHLQNFIYSNTVYTFRYKKTQAICYFEQNFGIWCKSWILNRTRVLIK